MLWFYYGVVLSILAVLVVLMIVGRLEVFPVLLTAAVAWRGVRDGTRHRVRHVVDRLRLLR